MALTLDGTTGITTSGSSSSGGSGVSTNTALGGDALKVNEAGGTNNTAIGYQALDANTTGDQNTAVGSGALDANTTASNNTAVGYQALYTNTTGSRSTAVGVQAGYSVATNDAVTAVGYFAGYSNTGGFSTFFGRNAGYLSTAASGTMIGDGAGSEITTGGKNTILGRYTGNQGGLDIRTASNNIILSDGDGNPRLRINDSGHLFVPLVRASAGDYAARWTGSLELTLDLSSARYKDNIRESVYGLNDLLRLQSRQFEYKDDGRSDVGLIAEEVYEVIPELTTIDKQGRPDAVSYDRMVSVCIKAIQELSAQVTALQAEVNALKGAE